MAKNYLTVPTLALLTFTAACTTGPDYKPPSAAALKLPASFTGQEGHASDNERALSVWWTHFNDPLLTQLIDEARTDNPDIAQAVARLRSARASLSSSQAEFFPSLNTSARGGRNFSSDAPDRNSYSAGADVSWTVDLFGGLTREAQASRADFEAAGYDLHALHVALSSEIASTYIELRALQSRLTIARENLAAQDETLQIAGWRVQAGLVSSLDAEQARANRAQTAASIPSLESALAASLNRLAVLTGEAPGALHDTLGQAAPMVAAADDIAIDIPADVIARRPDVRSGERALAAATARIGVAKARLYPALNLSGNIGTSALSLGTIGDVVTGGLFGAITAPLFDGGRIRQQINIRTAQQEAAFAAYRKAVLTALEDVENALIGLRSSKVREAELATAFDAANNAALLARSQYSAGLTDFQTLLSAERTLLSAQDGLASARADRAAALVRLYTAAGGGWDPTINPQNLLETGASQ